MSTLGKNLPSGRRREKMAAIKAEQHQDIKEEEIKNEGGGEESSLDDSTFSAILAIVLMLGTLGFVIYFFYL